MGSRCWHTWCPFHWLDSFLECHFSFQFFIFCRTPFSCIWGSGGGIAKWRNTYFNGTYFVRKIAAINTNLGYFATVFENGKICHRRFYYFRKYKETKKNWGKSIQYANDIDMLSCTRHNTRRGEKMTISKSNKTFKETISAPSSPAPGEYFMPTRKPVITTFEVFLSFVGLQVNFSTRLVMMMLFFPWKCKTKIHSEFYYQ